MNHHHQSNNNYYSKNRRIRYIQGQMKVIEHFANGIRNHNNGKYNDAINEFKLSLIGYESISGRYDDGHIGHVYYRLAYSYYENNNFNNALTTARTAIRYYISSSSSSTTTYHDNDDYLSSQSQLEKLIENCLKKLKNNNNNNNNFTNNEIFHYITNLQTSIQLEEQGNQLRYSGKFISSINKFKQAISLEINANIGNSITLSYLYRNVAQIILLSYILLKVNNNQTSSTTTITYSNINNSNNNNKNRKTNRTSSSSSLLLFHWNYIDNIDNEENKLLNKAILQKIYDSIKLWYSSERHSSTSSLSLITYSKIHNIFDKIQNGDKNHMQYNHSKALQYYKRIVDDYDHSTTTTNNNNTSTSHNNKEPIEVAEEIYQNIITNFITNGGNRRDIKNSGRIGIIELI